jgi:hypothetical protein
LVVAVAEEFLQLRPGERPLRRVGLVLLDVRGGVPLVHDLDRVGAEAVFALLGPAVGRVRDEPAERTHRVLVRADRRALHMPDRAGVAEPLVQHLRRPLPGEGIHRLGERAHRAAAPRDRRDRQVPGQLLVAPALQHGVKYLFLRAQ